MYGMEFYLAVRRAVTPDGLSTREAVRRFGKDPRTIKKMMSFSEPPGYRRTKSGVRRVLVAFEPIINQILAEDAKASVKQRRWRLTDRSEDPQCNGELRQRFFWR